MVSVISFKHVSFVAALFLFSCESGSADEKPEDKAAATADTVVQDTRVNIKRQLQDNTDSTTLLLSEAQKAELSKDPQKLQQYRADFAEHLPKPHNWVNDFDDLFTRKQESSLNELISGFEKESGMQMAVVTLDTFSMSRDHTSDAALNIYNAWGIGTKERNDGLLVTVVKGYGYMRINTGSGTQQILSDATADSIMRASFFPSFADSNFYKGTRTGLNALMSYMRPNVSKIK